MTLVSVDPGLRVCGVAVFTDGVLTRALLVKNPEQRLRGPVAWLAMAEAVSVEVKGCDELVVEVPQVYGAGKQKGDPNDLIQVAGVGAWVGSALNPKQATGYLPREWKGQVPKEVHNARIEKKLTTQELSVFDPCPPSLRHNVLDAVGLGLYHLRRNS